MSWRRLYSCGIDNVYVELDALELPILDGSSKPFIDLLARAGTRTLRRRRRYIRVSKPLEFSDGDRRIGIYPAEEFHVHCFVDYNHPVVGPQEVEMTVDRESFSRELAPARTFGFVKDFPGMQAMGLIRGGSLENAIVLDNDSVLNGPLRFPDEFGRHKAFDLIGDLALVGRPLKARIVAHKAGHALHTQLVTRLLADRTSGRNRDTRRRTRPIRFQVFCNSCISVKFLSAFSSPTSESMIRQRHRHRIIAAGKGTRMRSELAKVLHRAGGRPLIEHVIRACQPLKPAQLLVVVGHQAEEVGAVVNCSWRANRSATAAARHRPRDAGRAARHSQKREDCDRCSGRCAAAAH